MIRDYIILLMGTVLLFISILSIVTVLRDDIKLTTFKYQTREYNTSCIKYNKNGTCKEFEIVLKSLK